MGTRRRRDSRMPWLRILLAGLAAAAALALGGWYYWTGTVDYSLQRLALAVKDHNRYLFEKHVDMDALLRQMVDEFLETDLQEALKEPMGPLEQIAAGMGITIVQLIKPRLVDEVRYALIRGVESGALERGDLSTKRRPSQDAMGEAMMQLGDELPKLKPLKLGGIRRQGGSASVELQVQLDDGLPAHPEALQVRFVRTPDRYWRATEVENFRDILRVWNGRMTKRLEAANQPVRRMLNETVTVVNATKEQGLNVYGTGKDIWVVVTMKNNTSAGITALEADVTIRDTGGILKEVRIQDADVLPPKETGRKVWPIGANLLDPTELSIYNADPKALTIEVNLRHVVLSDGREIKVAESMDEVTDTLKKRPIAPPPTPAPIESL